MAQDRAIRAELEGTLVVGEAPAVEVAPRKEPSTPGEWIHENLFSSWFNSVLTVVLAIVIAYVGFGLIRWVFTAAEWQVVKANFRVYMIGRFPLEQAWRVWASLYLVALLAGVSWGESGARLAWTPWKAALRVVLGALLLAALIYLIESGMVRILAAAAAVVCAVGVVAGRRMGRGARRWVTVGWLAAFPAVILILRAFGGVPPQLWGGFMLNVLLAVVAIFVSFPIGVLLALGRRSRLPVISSFCVGFIELVRGVPLFTLIILGFNILPLLLPPGMQLAVIVRMMIVFTLFSSAYVAEIVRGGLQGVHQGQYEAARAVGLSTTRMMGLIILPQALRNTIPAMISHFISLFKDTSLLTALAILEMLRAARRAAGQLQHLGSTKEALIAAGLIFWIVAFSMSRWSQRLERRLGVGER
jgi:general L-amino acid transport system permease protein